MLDIRVVRWFGYVMCAISLAVMPHALTAADCNEEECPQCDYGPNGTTMCFDDCGETGICNYSTCDCVPTPPHGG